MLFRSKSLAQLLREQGRREPAFQDRLHRVRPAHRAAVCGAVAEDDDVSAIAGSLERGAKPHPAIQGPVRCIGVDLAGGLHPIGLLLAVDVQRLAVGLEDRLGLVPVPEIGDLDGALHRGPHDRCVGLTDAQQCLGGDRAYGGSAQRLEHCATCYFHHFLHVSMDLLRYWMLLCLFR